MEELAKKLIEMKKALDVALKNEAVAQERLKAASQAADEALKARQQAGADLRNVIAEIQKSVS